MIYGGSLLKSEKERERGERGEGKEGSHFTGKKIVTLTCVTGCRKNGPF